jgi:hypothetical protein
MDFDRSKPIFDWINKQELKRETSRCGNDPTRDFIQWDRVKPTSPVLLQSYLEVSELPSRISDLWIGHGDANISDRYSKMLEMAKERKSWAEKAGLGFELPAKSKKQSKGKAP